MYCTDISPRHGYWGSTSPLGKVEFEKKDNSMELQTIFGNSLELKTFYLFPNSRQPLESLFLLLTHALNCVYVHCAYIVYTLYIYIHTWSDIQALQLHLD